MKRRRAATKKTKLLRSFVGKDKDYFTEVFEGLPEESPHVVSRTVQTTRVSVPAQVSDDPAEIARKTS